MNIEIIFDSFVFRILAIEETGFKLSSTDINWISRLVFCLIISTDGYQIVFLGLCEVLKGMA